MSILTKIHKGKTLKPYFLLIYSPPGVGKTTWASCAPAPLIVCAEDGADTIDVDKTPLLQSWDEFEGIVDELTNLDQMPYKTIVIDGLDSLEALLHAKLKGKADSMALAMGGYGSAFQAAQDAWSKVLKKLKALREKQSVNIILIGHSVEVEKADPLSEQNYMQYTLNLYHGKSASSREVVFNGVDAILFANFDTYTTGEGKSVRGQTGERILFTEYCASYVAKNRYNLPAKLPLDFGVFDSHVRGFFDNKKEELLLRANKIKDEELKKKVIFVINQNKNLSAIEERLELVLKGQK